MCRTQAARKAGAAPRRAAVLRPPRTAATPAPKVAATRLAVAAVKPCSCSQSVKNTAACQGKQPTMPWGGLGMKGRWGSMHFEVGMIVGVMNGGLPGEAAHNALGMAT